MKEGVVPMEEDHAVMFESEIPKPVKNVAEFMTKPTAGIEARDLTKEEEQAKVTKIFQRLPFEKHVPLHQRFLVRDKKFTQQFSHLYFVRLNALRRVVAQAAEQKWKKQIDSGEFTMVERILNVKQGVKSIVVGTLYKEMPLKPNILNEYTTEMFAAAEPPRSNYVSEKDSLILEDESGRMNIGDVIHGDGNGHFKQLLQGGKLLVTGMVIAIMGMQVKGGHFEVYDTCVAGVPPQPLLPSLDSLSQKPLPTDKYVALISGMQVGGRDFEPLSLQMAVDYITGNIGSSGEEEFASQIVRVIIVGNSVSAPEGRDEVIDVRGQSIAPREQASLVGPMKMLDSTVLAPLAQSVEVDLMPGSSDPSNYTLPQQPINRCMLPQSSQFTTMHLASNPYEFELDGVRFLGTSGQTIDDVGKYTTFQDPLDIMEQTLQWRHIAPTAPDTLGCYAFTDRDPFILETCPHVYFIGNQKRFSTRLVRESNSSVVSRLVCVPAFSVEQPTIVLVNLRTLNCHPLHFDLSL